MDRKLRGPYAISKKVCFHSALMYIMAYYDIEQMRMMPLDKDKDLRMMPLGKDKDKDDSTGEMETIHEKNW